MTRFILALIVLSATAAAAFAQEPGARPTQTTVWEPILVTGGCTIVGDPSAAAEMRFTWDQQCIPGQPIDGQGTLHVAVNDGRSITVTGRFVGGVPHGDVALAGYDANGSPISQITIEYNMGCVVAEGGCTPYQPH